MAQTNLGLDLIQETGRPGSTVVKAHPLTFRTFPLPGKNLNLSSHQLVVIPPTFLCELSPSLAVRIITS